jgi:hypothetical protein
MISRKAVAKLKAILIIDLLVVAVAAGAYFYIQNQGLIATALKPAEFTVTDLTINPLEAEQGDPILISANVTNIGDLEGIYSANLTINNVIIQNQTISLAGNKTSTMVEFTVTEETVGNYTAEIGQLNGTFRIKPPSPTTSSIHLSNLVADPYEGWANQTITFTASATNYGNETDNLSVRLMVDNLFVEMKKIELAAGATTTVEFEYNATTEGRHSVSLNGLTGSFTVVKNGYHTLLINRSGGGSTPLPFTLDGVSHNTPYTELLPVGEHSLSVPSPFSVGTGVLQFSYWSDGVTTTSRTVNLQSWLILVVTYTVISGYASCPSLYIWNGTGYSYVTDVSNAGWLGYINYITNNGNIVYGGGNPWDYVKLNKNLLAIKNINGNNYFDMTITQQWDELFYLDTAYMLVVDHPVGTDVYSTMSNYANPAFNGQLYTVNKKGIMLPVSATYVWGPIGTNQKGENVLPQISKLDGVFTPGNNGLLSPSWNNINLNQLTLDLGSLSAAKQIKLVINGMVDWGLPGPYYDWIDAFKAAAAQGLVPNGTRVYPAPYMDVKDANGKWIRVPQDKQIPTPSDFNSRNFVVDLTGLFPKGTSDYQIRINNFFNVTFDYIGIDVTTQQNIRVQRINPIATLSQMWDTQTTSSGNFTRYGDVTALVQNADDEYVIGRQCDQVSLEFPTNNLTAPAQGMERDYFFVVACWFKDPPGNWGYGFSYTVDPLPFIGMSGFPYPANESYPYDAARLAYLKEYNTRVIIAP